MMAGGFHSLEPVKLSYLSDIVFSDPNDIHQLNGGSSSIYRQLKSRSSYEKSIVKTIDNINDAGPHGRLPKMPRFNDAKKYIDAAFMYYCYHTEYDKLASLLSARSQRKSLECMLFTELERN